MRSVEGGIANTQSNEKGAARTFCSPQVEEDGGRPKQCLRTGILLQIGRVKGSSAIINRSSRIITIELLALCFRLHEVREHKGNKTGYKGGKVRDNGIRNFSFSQ